MNGLGGESIHVGFCVAPPLIPADVNDGRILKHIRVFHEIEHETRPGERQSDCHAPALQQLGAVPADKGVNDDVPDLEKKYWDPREA